jgi:hypothetical protein
LTNPTTHVISVASVRIPGVPIEESPEAAHSLLQALDAAALAEDENAPHVVLIVDAELGPGPAAGPFAGALPALVAAERLETALNHQTADPPVRARVVRLFTPRP